MEGELRQIVSNLFTNSIDALGSGGVLHVRTNPVHAGRPMIRLSVADTGSGISASNLKKIFEPFFTTKQSVGVGLGLAVTRDLVKKHEGKIYVRSEVGKGTVVAVWLPTDRRAQERESAA